MPAQITIAHTVNGIGDPIIDNNSYTSGQASIIQEAVPAATDTTFNNFDVDVSECEAVVMKCDRDVTIKVNDDGTPDATIALLAGKPLVWKNDGYFLNPLGVVDVTSLKVTVPAGDDANLQIEVFQDPTP